MLGLADLFPAVQDMTGSDKTTVGIHKKSSSNDLDKAKNLLFVGVTTNDRNDGLLDFVYCVDGNIFLAERWIHGNEEQCRNNNIPHSGTAIISDEHLRRDYTPIETIAH
jgi:hypothetical protein